MAESRLNLCEVTISELTAAYKAGGLSAVAVVERYLNRIAAYDQAGSCLNSLIVLNPDVFDAAQEADARHAAGMARPLEGVPFTVKDSYMVQGLTVAAGSPAFAGLVAQWDAFTVAQLKAAGAILIGKTNMPPMADGGMQRGVYGRAENPYNTDYLAAAYASGSSNGSGVSTAANFAVFGMGEETVSSGRSPASNNALCAYTPSWGVISIRGNWPLFPARDVVVPHTRTMLDMLQILNVLVADDPQTRGDFWRHQQAVEIPRASAIRPQDYSELAAGQPLAGKIFAVPRMYLGKDPRFPMPVRQSVLDLWQHTAERLQQFGAKLVETDFPLIEEYEGDKPAGENIDRLGVLPPGWMETEFNHFLAFGWDDFLRANGDPELSELSAVDPDTIFPLWPGTLPDRYEEVPNYEDRYREVVRYAREGIADPRERQDFVAGLQALLRLRAELFENWLDEHGFDGVVFPANADAAHESADCDIAANDHAWANGVLFSNGNYALRHFGIPTVTVPMGVMADIGVPVGVTFAGRAYDDNALLAYAAQFDKETKRPLPAAAPCTADDVLLYGAMRVAKNFSVKIAETAAAVSAGGVAITVTGKIIADIKIDFMPLVRVSVQGVSAEVNLQGRDFTAQLTVPRPDYGRNPDPQQLMVVVTAVAAGMHAGAYVTCGY